MYKEVGEFPLPICIYEKPNTDEQKPKEKWWKKRERERASVLSSLLKLLEGQCDLILCLKVF